jgi:hypothetical protein
MCVAAPILHPPWGGTIWFNTFPNRVLTIGTTELLGTSLGQEGGGKSLANTRLTLESMLGGTDEQKGMLGGHAGRQTGFRRQGQSRW